MLRDCLRFISVRFAIIKYTSKSDRKIAIIERQTDRLADNYIPWAAFVVEN